MTEHLIAADVFGEATLCAASPTTGELLRELTSNPHRDYQPTGRPPGPPKRKKTEP